MEGICDIESVYRFFVLLARRNRTSRAYVLAMSLLSVLTLEITNSIRFPILNECKQKLDFYMTFVANQQKMLSLVLRSIASD